ncbi:MAG TPA: hypothetical protein VFC39_20475 [Acidobacteriaceae bacterium]|nr:hypothetical protein [Acidobacteriaceae bacterium]
MNAKPAFAENSTASAWHYRAATTLSNGIVEATVLPGGGHLAAWRFVGGDNTLFESPWLTADPSTPAHASLAAQYGEPGVGEFLASFTGHALCLDGFGPPSPADLDAGVALHGEAPVATWDFSSPHSAFANLPVAGLRVQRQFHLAEAESVLRVDERVTNLRATARDLHWVQHATVGTVGARVTASVSDGLTWPLDYEHSNLLARDTKFEWPYAPGADGRRVDLREMLSHPHSGFVAAIRQTPTQKHGFVATCDAASRLAMGYIFLSEIFPWLTIWEENRARPDAPWCGRVQARGIEFGTTPFPLGNEAVDAHGPVLGAAVSRRIGPHETLRAPWLLFLATLPQGWTEIEDITLDADAIVLRQSGAQLRLAAKGALAFLDAGPKEPFA